MQSMFLDEPETKTYFNPGSSKQHRLIIINRIRIKFKPSRGIESEFPISPFNPTDAV